MEIVDAEVAVHQRRSGSARVQTVSLAGSLAGEPVAGIGVHIVRARPVQMLPEATVALTQANALGRSEGAARTT